jgi:zinc transport system substrate-binding protein
MSERHPPQKKRKTKQMKNNWMTLSAEIRKRYWKKACWSITISILLGFSPSLSHASENLKTKSKNIIVTSDTILSGMIDSLLPPGEYLTEAILPPGQCPGHYDVRLSDIEKMTRADLIVSFRGMPFMDKAGSPGKGKYSVDAGGRNWMAPDSYIHGLGILADCLSRYFPEDKEEIMVRKEDSIRQVKEGAALLLEKIKRSGGFGRPIIASSMQKETLEWMGFVVIATYGRQESISARELVRLLEIGKRQKAMIIVDNLQSGPDTGRGIAESLGIPHIVLTNFPSEKGYLATLEENIRALSAGVAIR